MCRFVLLAAPAPCDMRPFVVQFAQMCQRSTGLNGEGWQGDGWGVAWQEKEKWNLNKSLSPIWKDQIKFASIPRTKLFVAHARSAGFPQHKNNLDFNQPYISDNLCFVFNGMIRGVKIPRVLEGQIGAQKIFSYLKQEIRRYSPDRALRQLNQELHKYSKIIEGMNIGLISNDKLYVLCQFNNNQDYFGLRYTQNPEETIICSEPIARYSWNLMGKGEVLIFK